MNDDHSPTDGLVVGRADAPFPDGGIVHLYPGAHLMEMESIDVWLSETRRFHDSVLIEVRWHDDDIALCFEFGGDAEKRIVTAHKTSCAMVAVGNPVVDSVPEVLFSIDFHEWIRSLAEDSVDIFSLSVRRDQEGRCFLELYGSTNEQVRIFIICQGVVIDSPQPNRFA